jgi:hypothetical protein
MLFRTTLRPTTARLAYTASLAVLCTLGCANRGMVAPQGEGGVSTGGTGGALKTDGGAGAGGHGGSATGGNGGKGGGSGGGGGKGGGGDAGGAGSGGKGGASGATGKDAGCSLLADASVEHSTTSCNALFNFESGLEGATIFGTGSAFQSLAKASTPTYCGSGSLAITAHFSGTTGAATKGEVDLPIGTDGGTANVNGKTLTVHVSANPACDPRLTMTVVVIAASGAQEFPLRNVPVTANWNTASATLTADGGENSAIKIALDFSSIDGYQGTIYVDEIDVR